MEMDWEKTSTVYLVQVASPRASHNKDSWVDYGGWLLCLS